MVAASNDPVDALILDLLEWLDGAPRPYGDVMEAWRRSCPRLPVWEEANDREFVARRRVSGSGSGELVVLTPVGNDHLRRQRPSSPHGVIRPLTVYVAR